MTSLPTTNQGWIELGNQYLLRHPRRTASIVPERGEGINMWDVEGKRYIDFQSGQLCVTLGHCHPEYVTALTEQAGRIMQTGTTFVAPSEVLLAKKIAELAPDPLQRSFFACTGSESNEMAIRLAQKYTGRFEIVGVQRGYHGQSFGSASITGRGGMLREGYGPMVAGASFIPTPYTYRCHYCKNEDCCNLGCADSAELVIDTCTSGKPAALFLEPMMSAAGQIVPSVEWMERIAEICKDRGILLVADEALTCFGRTGKWFAFEHFGVVPDVVTCSKGLGGAVPICAVVTSEQIAEAATENGFMTFSSHQGDPLLCAAALANLEIVDRESLVENARVVGEYFMERLQQLVAGYDIVGEARGLGLCLGIEMVTDKKSRAASFEAAAAVADYCLENGLLLQTILGDDLSDPLKRRQMEISGTHVLRFMPPITVNREQIDEAMDIVEDGVRLAQELIAV